MPLKLPHKKKKDNAPQQQDAEATQQQSAKRGAGKNECQIGDIVKVMETRPLSKNKRWRFVELISRAE